MPFHMDHLKVALGPPLEGDFLELLQQSYDPSENEYYGSLEPHVWNFLPKVRKVSSQREALRVFASAMDLLVISVWRFSKNVYQIHPEVLESLLESKPTVDVPCEVLFKLPHWCVYVPCTFNGTEIIGFWAMLDRDSDGGMSLLVTLNRKGPTDSRTHQSFLKTPLEVGAPLSERQTITDDEVLSNKGGSLLSVSPLINNILLYLCSKNRDLMGDPIINTPDFAPRVKKKRRSLKKPKVNYWKVGYRIGPKLASSKKAHKEGSSGSDGSTKRPHVRRAHFHSYWCGSRTDPHLELRWVPPVFVNSKMEEAEKRAGTINPVI